MNRTGRDYHFRLIALAVIYVQTLCLLLTAGSYRLQSQKMQQLREELTQERHTLFNREFYDSELTKAFKEELLDDKYIHDLKERLRAYEAAYPEPAGLRQSEPGVIIRKPGYPTFYPVP